MMKMDKTTILGYVVTLLLPGIVMYGTGYNETADALILTMVWILLILGMFGMLILALAGIALAAVGIGESVDLEIKTKMEKAKANLRLWPITVALAIWMLVALSSVEWTGTAITFFIIWLLTQISSRLFVNTFTSMEAKLDAKT